MNHKKSASEWAAILQDENNKILGSLKDLESTNIYSLMQFIYKYGLKKSSTTPRLETLEGWSRTINRDSRQIISPDDLMNILKFVRLYTNINWLLYDIFQDGWSVKIVWDRWCIGGYRYV